MILRSSKRKQPKIFFKYKNSMNFSNRKIKSFSNQRIIPIVQRKSKSKKTPFQGTIDYKNVVLLRKFISAEGKILPRRLNGLNAKQQRYIAKAIKNARMMGLLPFVNHSQPISSSINS